MSEHSYAGLQFKTNLEKHPEVFTINEKELEGKIAKTIKSSQALHAQNDAAKNTGQQEERKEYNRLLQDHFNLKQWVRSCENRVNESAGGIRNLEQRINDKLTEKKNTESPLGKRNIENTIVRLEGELAEEKTNYEKLRKENLQAVKQLKGFDVARIDALKAELDAPKVIGK